jgi:hypothetical protein
MHNPIPHSKLFNTRALEDIQTDIDRLPPKDKALVYQYVMATLNSCHALVEEAIEDSKGAW